MGNNKDYSGDFKICTYFRRWDPHRLVVVYKISR